MIWLYGEFEESLAESVEQQNGGGEEGLECKDLLNVEQLEQAWANILGICQIKKRRMISIVKKL